MWHNDDDLFHDFHPQTKNLDVGPIPVFQSWILMLQIVFTMLTFNIYIVLIMQVTNERQFVGKRSQELLPDQRVNLH